MKKYSPIPLTVALASIIPLHAQPFELQVRPFQVLQSGAIVGNPFSGGVDAPQFQFVDIDGDGDYDLFVLDKDSRLTLYRNQGTPSVPNFILETIGFQNLSVGAWFKFADIDGDGDLDLLIGSEDGKLAMFERKGTSSNPVFEFVTNTYVNLAGLFNISPTFGDINNDGILDLIVGDANGKLHLYKNAGGWQEDATFQLRSVSFGQNASPVLADIDNDGKKDLFVGTGGGQIFYYRNVGTASVANFVRQTNLNPSLDSIDVGDDAKPVLVDFDHDGDLDLIVGARDGSVRYFQNTGTPSAFSFTRITNFFGSSTAVVRSAPAVADADGDGDLDLFLGNIKGGLYFYRNQNIVLGVAREEQLPLFQLEQNFPNPFNPTTVISYQLSAVSFVSLVVYDVLGREVRTLVSEVEGAGSHRVLFDGGGFPSGVYFYRLSSRGLLQSKKMILVR